MSLMTGKSFLPRTSWFQVYSLVRNDIRTRYARNLFGSIWAVLDPFIYIVVIWIIFKYALKGPGINGESYIAFLIPGFIIFDFCSKALSYSVVSFRTYSYLLNSTSFNHIILPLIQILSEAFIHFLVLFISIPVLMINHIPASIYWTQVIYYTFSAFILTAGISITCSSLYLFFPDIKVVIDIILRLLFFITPVFWNLDILPVKVQYVFKLNPFYYVVNGYRDSLIYGIGIWHKPGLTCYFWIISIISLAAGLIIYKRLRPQFAELV